MSTGACGSKLGSGVGSGVGAVVLAVRRRVLHNPDLRRLLHVSELFFSSVLCRRRVLHKPA
jgi:hypothetical protein